MQRTPLCYSSDYMLAKDCRCTCRYQHGAIVHQQIPAYWIVLSSKHRPVHERSEMSNLHRIPSDPSHRILSPSLYRLFWFLPTFSYVFCSVCVSVNINIRSSSGPLGQRKPMGGEDKQRKAHTQIQTIRSDYHEGSALFRWALLDRWFLLALWH